MDSVLWSVAPPAAAMGPEAHPAPYPASVGQDLPAGANIEVLSWNRTEQVVERISRGDVAAVIMEAAMCNSGATMPLPGYLEAVREACTRTGTVLICDEVITGFRVAPGGAQQRLGVTPDLATFAKAIANGFSVAAVAGRADLMDRLVGGGVIHGGTYNAQAVNTAATVATLKRLSTPGIYGIMEARGRRLMDGFTAAFHEAGIPATITGFPQIFHVGFGLKTAPMKARMAELEAEKARLQAAIAGTAPPSPLRLHGGLPEVYRRLVIRLESALGNPLVRDEAAEALRSMIKKVVLKPRADGGLDGELYGKLAEILHVCEAAQSKSDTDGTKQKRPSGEPEGRLLSVVAGKGNQLCLLTVATNLEQRQC